MHGAIRPVLVASIAFAGAGIIATAPFTPSLPDVQIPSITTPTLELAALPSYLEWVQSATDALTYQLPTLDQIIESGLDGLMPIVEQLISHPFPDIDALTTGLAETGVPPTSAQDVASLLLTTQTSLGDGNILPEFVQGLVSVVEDITDFASSAVEPVIDTVVKITLATLTRLSEIYDATLTDVPHIVSALVSGTRTVVGTLVDNVKLVAEAAASMDPLAVLQAATDGLLNVQNAVTEQSLKVIAALDKFRVDIETALALPEWLPMPAKSRPSSAVPPSGAATALKTTEKPSSGLDLDRANIGSNGLGAANPAAARVRATGTPSAGRTAPGGDTVAGDTKSQAPSADDRAAASETPTAGGSTESGKPDHDSPDQTKNKGGSRRHSAKHSSE